MSHKDDLQHKLGKGAVVGATAAGLAYGATQVGAVSDLIYPDTIPFIGSGGQSAVGFAGTSAAIGSIAADFAHVNGWGGETLGALAGPVIAASAAFAAVAIMEPRVLDASLIRELAPMLGLVAAGEYVGDMAYESFLDRSEAA